MQKFGAYTTNFPFTVYSLLYVILRSNSFRPPSCRLYNHIQSLLLSSPSNLEFLLLISCSTWNILPCWSGFTEVPMQWRIFGSGNLRPSTAWKWLGLVLLLFAKWGAVCTLAIKINVYIVWIARWKKMYNKDNQLIYDRKRHKSVIFWNPTLWTESFFHAYFLCLYDVCWKSRPVSMVGLIAFLILILCCYLLFFPL